MRLSGQGITGYKTVHIKPDFSPITDLALKWAQCANGNWVATDRGTDADIYRSKIRVYGTEETINELLTAIYDNRTVDHADAGKLLLDWIEDDEDQKIFGADIDYSSGVYVTITGLGERKQMSFHAWQILLDLRVWDTTELSFTGSHASTISFDYVDFGFIADQERTISKHEIYNTYPVLADRRVDSGYLEFTATVPIDDMVTFRRSLAYHRDAAITTTIIKGVNYPYGPNLDNSWSKNLKYIETREMGLWGQHYWRVACRCAEDRS